MTLSKINGNGNQLPINSKKVTFKGALGETLAGRLDLPVDNMKAGALFAHCFTCSKSLKVVGNIAKELVANDIGVLRFDFTGLGQSEGEFANNNFSSNVDDLLAAVDFMKEESGGPHLLRDNNHSRYAGAMIATWAQLYL